ncbi:MAG: hypothetical protein O9292_10215 [Rhodobacteraceae bacterium]|nr:hypothetical protein [Paracoccaceae bacterium]
MKKGHTMKVLQERLNSILQQKAKLQVEEDLVRDLIREANGEPKAKVRAPRANVKQSVLDLLEQVGANGLNAVLAVELAAKAGVTLERGTVSSLLSRLKNEGVVDYDNTVYRLKKFKVDGPNVLPLRTSGVFS